MIKIKGIKIRELIKAKSPYLVDILDDAEREGCAACYI